MKAYFIFKHSLGSYWFLSIQNFTIVWDDDPTNYQLFRTEEEAMEIAKMELFAKVAYVDLEEKDFHKYFLQKNKIEN